MRNKLIWLTIFSVSMGFLESAVVIYMRELLYPEGFHFPLKAMKNFIILTELLREAATIFMIWGIAMIASKHRHMRFGWFLYVFALWDIFYYVFLKIILDWPQSWFTWDVLFLIPVVWVGPVLAPIILCFFMLLLWFIIHHYYHLGHITIAVKDYVLLTLGTLIQIINFCWDNQLYLLNSPKHSDLGLLQLNYIPISFNWWLFSIGSMLMVGAIFNIWKRNKMLIKNLKRGQLF
jgi:hypothetical protein